MSDKMLGKIERISFGHGGYQDAMIGLTFTFSGKGWGVGHFEGFWAGPRPSAAKWTEQDRIKDLGELVIKISKLLSEAKISDINALKGIPVECEFENQVLKSWRILTEVV